MMLIMCEIKDVIEAIRGPCDSGDNCLSSPFKKLISRRRILFKTQRSAGLKMRLDET